MTAPSVPTSAPDQPPRIDVAVGVLVRAENGVPECLMSSRAGGRAMDGHWEFPGGKFEPGETGAEALVRELREELGVTVRAPLFWRSLDVDYAHACVRLHFYWVWNWAGDITPAEGQQVRWVARALLDASTEVSLQRLEGLGVHPVLPGTVPVLQWLAQEAWAGRFIALQAPSTLHDNALAFADDLRWDDKGLLPAIAQEAGTGDVLMVAWMNREALLQTALRGEAVYFSRSRGRLWHKGEQSCHVQQVQDIRLDCDQDVLLLQVRQLGHEPGIACHTGRHSCFYSGLRAGQWQTCDDAPVLKNPADIYGGA